MLLSLVSFIISLITALIWNIIDLQVWWVVLLQIIIQTISIELLVILLCIIISLCIKEKDDIIKPKKFFVIMNYIIFDFFRVFFRVKINLRKNVQIDYNKHYLLICNHQSNLDPFIIEKCLHKLNIGFIIKKELHDVHILKGWTYASGFYAMDRQNPRNAIRTIIQSINSVQERTICAFPEGTRSKDGVLLEFKDGIFKVAQKGNVDILVCTIDDIHNVKKRFPFRSTKVKFEISKIVSREEISELQTKEISNLVRDIVNNNLRKMREE